MLPEVRAFSCACHLRRVSGSAALQPEGAGVHGSRCNVSFRTGQGRMAGIIGNVPFPEKTVFCRPGSMSFSGMDL